MNQETKKTIHSLLKTKEYDSREIFDYLTGIIIQLPFSLHCEPFIFR